MKALLASNHITPAHVEAFRNMLGGAVDRALCITAAAVPYGTPAPAWLEESFAPLRPLATTIDTTLLEPDDWVPDDLSAYGFVFVSGGSVFYLAYRLVETKFAEKLKTYMRSEGVYAGSSAGSIICMDSIEYFAPADDPALAPAVFPGLGMVKEAIIPHIDNKKYETMMREIAGRYQQDGLETTCLNDGQVLLIDGDSKRVV